MKKILIVYYSKSGHTKKIAEELASLCNADIEAIKPYNDGDSGWRCLSAIIATGMRKGSAIEHQKYNPGDYDLVILGTPIWMWKTTSFTSQYIEENTKRIRNVAFFCTEGGSGDDKAFRQMAESLGRQPKATLTVTEQELKDQSYPAKLQAFTDNLVSSQLND